MVDQYLTVHQQKTKSCYRFICIDSSSSLSGVFLTLNTKEAIVRAPVKCSHSLFLIVVCCGGAADAHLREALFTNGAQSSPFNDSADRQQEEERAGVGGKGNRSSSGALFFFFTEIQPVCPNDPLYIMYVICFNPYFDILWT